MKLLLANGKSGTIVSARATGRAGQFRNEGSTIRTRLNRPSGRSSTRAQQTLAALGVDCPTEITGELYNAGGDRILAALREVPDDVRGVIVVAHAPGLPGLVYELADPETSDPQALAVLETQFPPATLATLQLTDDWAHLRQATLTELRLP